MKLTRKSKIVIATVTAIAFILVLAFLITPPLRMGAMTGPILKYGGGVGGAGELFHIFCGNGTVFYEATNPSREVRTAYYYGRLSPIDMAEFRAKLGTSFVLKPGSQSIRNNVVTDVDGDNFAEYVDGGSPTRSITYEEYLKYGETIFAFEKRTSVPIWGNKVQDSFWHIPPMIVVPSVDCQPR